MQFYRFRGRQDTEAQRLRRGGEAYFSTFTGVAGRLGGRGAGGTETGRSKRKIK